jgi:hypothetical protein
MACAVWLAACFAEAACRTDPVGFRLMSMSPGRSPDAGQGLESLDSVRTVEVAIRTYERRDAADVADVFYRSVREVALSDYTAEQLKAWVPRRWDAEQEHRRSGDGRLVVASEPHTAEVRGFAAIRDVCGLTCSEEVPAWGLASSLRRS